MDREHFPLSNQNKKNYNFFSLAIIYVIPHEIFQKYYTSNSSGIVESENFFLHILQ